MKPRWRNVMEVREPGLYLFRMPPELIGNASLVYVGKSRNGTMNMHGMENQRLRCKGNASARFYGPLPEDTGENS